MSGPDSLRLARIEEHGAIEALLRAAFAGPDEAGLVRRLRDEGRIEAEMVMPWQGGIVGYLALSQLLAPMGWLALAPVAIAPEWQGRRLGSRLVAGMAKLAAIKGQKIVVIGKPSFYARAGFSLSRAAGLRSPYPLSVTGFFGPGSDVPTADVVYPGAFDGV